jgi:hypothetical protein
MQSLEELFKDILQKEESATGGGTTAGATASTGEGEQYFSRGKSKKLSEDAPILAGGKVKDNYAVSHFGYKLAPHVPNRKSKMIDYKQLYENTDEVVAILKAANMDKDAKQLLMKGYMNGDITAETVKNIVNKMTGLEVNETVNENYARFRNQTKTRSKPEQFHQAIKELRKKVEEIGRLFEYVERMKSELNESGEGMKYKKHTENALKQIRESVTQLFITSRKLK